MELSPFHTARLSVGGGGDEFVGDRASNLHGLDSVQPSSADYQNVDGVSSKVFAIYKARNELLSSIVHGGDHQLIRDSEFRFEVLIDEPKGLLRQNFPIFSRSLAFFIHPMTRVFVTFCVFWGLLYVFVAVPMYYNLNCVSIHGTVANVQYYGGPPSFWLVNLVCYHLVSLVYTGRLFGASVGDVERGFKKAESSAKIGYLRLLEAKLKRASEFNSDSFAIPREGLFGRIVTLYFPVAFFLTMLVIYMIVVHDTFSPLNESIMLPAYEFDCASRKVLLDMTLASLGHIPELVAYTFPFCGNVVALYGLQLGTTLCRRDVGEWTERVKALKHLTEGDLVRYRQYRLNTRTRLEIRRDCFERYLLLHRLYRKSSKLWDVYLSSLLGLSTLSFIFYFVITILDAYSKQHLFGSGFSYLWESFFLTLVVSVLYLVSAANSHPEVKELFTFAVPFSADAELLLDSSVPGLGEDRIPAPAGSAVYESCTGDYALLGGRKEWLMFTHSAPLYWTISGIPITMERLTATLFTGLLSVCVSAIGKLFDMTPKA